MRAAEFFQRCLDAGIPTDMAVKAMKAFEAEVEIVIDLTLDKRRANDRERQARKRDKDNVKSRDLTLQPVTNVTSRDQRDGQDAPAPVHTRGEDNPSRLEVTGLVVVGGVDAREPDQQTDDWPKGDAAEHVKLLVAHVASPWLDPQKSPDLITTRARLAAWKRDGASWIHDVLPTIEGLMAGRRSKVSSWKFFDAAIGRAIADNRAALEIPEAQARAPPRQGITDKIADERRRATELTLAALKASNG